VQGNELSRPLRLIVFAFRYDLLTPRHISALRTSHKGQVCDAERNLRSYFRVAIIRAVSKAPTDAARWCAGRSNKYWLITVVFPKSKEHRSEQTSRQSSLSNVCPLLLCVFVCVCAC
jgi:hypothetical protein